MNISPLAVVHPEARLGENVTIDPFAVIEKDVTIGDNCHVFPHAVILDGARIGKNCKIHTSAVVAGVPQDLKFKGEYTTVEIGDCTTIRECATVNRGTAAKGVTRVGSNTLIMAYAHVGHDCTVGNNCVIVNGVSKGYAMTGWRIGFIAAPLWIAKACNKLQGQYTSGASSIAQKAAAAAFAGDQSCVEEMRRAFERRRDLVVRLAREIPGLKVNNPDGAFYLFPEVSCYLGKADGDRVIKTSSDLAMYILEVGHVATVAGDAFGAPNYLRLSYATSEENITEAMRRMKEVLARLK